MFEWDNYSIYDLFALESKDDYAKYMTKTLTAFKALEQVYNVKMDRDDEAIEESEIVLYFLKKLIYTFETIRLKYRFNNEESLRIDKSDSGFVNFYEIAQLKTDLSRDLALNNVSTDEKSIKENLLINLLQKKIDNTDLLSQFAVKKYQARLQKDRLFLFFNEGELILKEDSSVNFRKYLYYWACYDKLTNMPYIYLMDFEQDSSSAPLHKNAQDWDRFLAVVRSEGSRAPAAGIVAMAIDQRLETIHPKLLKRICLGPIYSKSFSVNLDSRLKDIFEMGDEGRKFIFHITEQFVFSVEQTIIQDPAKLGVLVQSKRVREKFYIPKPSDISNYTKFNELETQKASFIRKSVVMPYKLHQHLNGMYQDYKVISFSKSGDINGIK